MIEDVEIARKLDGENSGGISRFGGEEWGLWD